MGCVKFEPVRVHELERSNLREYLDLNGTWEFTLDRENKGLSLGWDKAEFGGLDDTISVPGCLEAQGKGLTYLPPSKPLWGGTCDMPYLGVSWYQKRFDLPENMRDRHLILNFGGVGTDCSVWLNGAFIGEHHFASVPFGFDVTDSVNRFGENTLTVRVENNHTYSSFTPKNNHGLGSTTMEMRWSGVYRGVELVALKNTSIADLHVIPHALEGKVELRCRLSGVGKNFCYEVKISPWDEREKVVAKSKENFTEGFCATLDIENPQFWSDEDPYLYRAEVTVYDDGKPVDSIIERFGLRDITYDGKHYLLNGKPVYLRGELVHYHWPRTISPCTDREVLREGLSTYKKYGFNFMRHHTHFPGVEYLEVCDELGLFCHNELAVVEDSWLIYEDMQEYAWEKLILRDRNHPSVMTWCMGNEKLASDEKIEKYRALTFSLDKTRFLLSNSPGWYIFEDGKRLRAPIAHEFRRAGASYADPSRKYLYDGALRPWRMLFAEERTAKNGLTKYIPDFVRNTQMLQAYCRKLLLEEVRLNDTDICDEWNLHGTRFEGYHLSHLRDSGSFFWGITDDFFNPKSVTPEELRHYSAPSVLIWGTHHRARCFRDNNRGVPVNLFCSHYGAKPVVNGTLLWRIVDINGKELYSRAEKGIFLECGEVGMLPVSVWLPPVLGTLRLVYYKLEARLWDENTDISNTWDFWHVNTQPQTENRKIPVCVRMHNLLAQSRLVQKCGLVASEPRHDGLYITDTVDRRLVSHLAEGGRALLYGRECLPTFVTEWGAGRSEFMRGTLIAEHPFTRKFPHKDWCELPFAPLIGGQEQLEGNRNALGAALDLTAWSNGIEPIIMAFPSCKDEEPRKMAHLFEVKIGRGRLLVTSFDLSPAAFVAPSGMYFWNALIDYAAGDEFNPEFEFSPEALKKFGDSSEFGDNTVLASPDQF